MSNVSAQETPQQQQSVRAALRSPRRLRTEVLAGLVVALALIPRRFRSRSSPASTRESDCSHRSRWPSRSRSSEGDPR